tara:strand:+ start:84 stop:1223 length:1140 start_codon:yes stop_codon:yes gene_type:complete
MENIQQHEALNIFIKHFSIIRDPRIDRKKLHNLVEIIIIAVIAVISGCENFSEIQEFAKERISWFKKFLILKSGIPSHDTFSRVFALLDGREFEKCFIEWMQEITNISKGEIIAIDGKTARRSFDTRGNKGPIHLVNAWACKNAVVLGQFKTEEKSNEITAIPKLLELLSIKNCIVTIDAMGTQKAIAKSIIEKEADYVLALKENQKQLHQDVEYSFETAIEKKFVGFDFDSYEESEKSHGRIETRKYCTLRNLDWLLEKEKWANLNSICMVTSTREVKGKISKETRYYISSLSGNAKKIGHAIRSHWSVENKLHWSLDVSFREDECRIRKQQGAENFAMLRKVALNFIKKEKTCKRGVQIKRHKAGWSERYLEKVLTA